MLTWAFLWSNSRQEETSKLGWVIPMACDVAIFYFIAVAFRGWA